MNELEETELEETKIIRQFILRNAPVRAQPRAQYCPLHKLLNFLPVIAEAWQEDSNYLRPVRSTTWQVLALKQHSWK